MSLSPPSRAHAVRRMFSGIARRYDFLNHLFSLGIDGIWRRVLVSEIPPAYGRPVLDVATGTGDVLLALAGRRADAPLVVGSDFTLPMLRIASAKISREPSGRIRLAAGDALALPFQDNTFSSATIAFGLRNLADRTAGLGEMTRVLRPGGKVLVLEFSRMDRPVIGPLFRFYFHRVIPFLGGILSGHREAYRYLPRSVDTFPDPSQLLEEMARAGLVNLACRPLTLGIAYLHTGEKAEDLKETEDGGPKTGGNPLPGPPRG